MSDKHTRRVKQYLEDLNEERDDLFQNLGKLISTANQQVQNISKCQASLSEKEALLTFLTKTLSLFSELNHTVLKNLETIDIPVSLEENIQTANNTQELQDYFKVHHASSFDFSKEGPKVPNDQVLNESYVRKPLNDVMLKAILCSNITSNTSLTNTSENVLHNTENNQSTLINIPACNHIPQDDTVHASLPTSPTLSCGSESDVFSTTGSSTYQHPLTKFRPPTKIPDQYDTKDLEKVKENMMYISRKMGFDSEGFAQMSSQFDKTVPSVNFQYEEPVRDVQLEAQNIVRESCQNITRTHDTDTFHHSSKEPNASAKTETLNNKLPQDLVDSSFNNQNKADGPPKSTGAIRKQKLDEEDLLEFSTSTSDSEGCDKVSSWLNHRSQSDIKLDKGSTDFERSKPTPSNPMKNNQSAVEKLGQMKRHDRNEEVREKARADMPDLKLVPVEIPKVIKNNLNSDGSSSEKSMNNISRKKSKVKDLNKEVVVYDIRKMEIPEVDTICVFSHIESPNEFYLQIVNDTNSSYLDKVSSSLNEKFSKTETKFSTKDEAYAKLGKYCYGYIWGEEKSWFRLQVLDWKLGCSTDEVDVQALDYGFKCTTFYTYLRELTTDLAHIPMLAIKCHFPLLYPPGSTYSNRITEWSSGTNEALYDIVNFSRNLNQVQDVQMFRISFAMLEGDSLGVDLVQYPDAAMGTLGELLIDMGLAIEIHDDYGENPEVGDFLEDIDELEKADNLNEFLLGYDAKDEARICRFTRNDGTCYKGKHCKLEHVQLKDYTTDKTTAFYTAINDLIFPVKGDIVQVLVTACVDSCTYLVQMIRNPVKIDNTGIIIDQAISDLMDAMNHSRLIAKYVSFKIYPAVGEMILAFHPIAKKWMRVAVRELNKNGDDDTIEVYSVDFGEEFLINTKNIRMMQEEFMHVPFQVIQIYLDNYQHRKDCDMKKAKTFFNKHIAYKSFLAKIQSNELPYKVSLTTFKGRDIGPTLAKEGFAERRKIDLHISEDKDKRRYFALE